MTTAEPRTLLAEGDLSVHGRMVAASNATFQGTVSAGPEGPSSVVVWKPVAGERPLWDFPDGTLADREYASFLVSEALGWSVVPPTLLRDGPAGAGMAQLWVDVDPDRELVAAFEPGGLPTGWLAVFDAVDSDGDDVVVAHADHPGLRRMALFDQVVNNTDRKGGHVLVTGDDRVYGVDHGVTFHPAPKLRTVLWGWAGEPIDSSERAGLEQLLEQLSSPGPLQRSLHPLITELEYQRTVDRLGALLAAGVFPNPDPDRYPIPWPPM